MENPPIPKESLSLDKQDELFIKLSSIVKEARSVVDELDPVVKRFELQNTEILFGLIGGLIFGLITYLLMLFYSSANSGNIIISTIISIPIGIILPMIVFRGLAQWKLEKNIRLTKIKLDAIREEIQELNKFQRVPAQIRDNIWLTYQETLEIFNQSINRKKEKNIKEIKKTC